MPVPWRRRTWSLGSQIALSKFVWYESRTGTFGIGPWWSSHATSVSRECWTSIVPVRTPRSDTSGAARKNFLSRSRRYVSKRSAARQMPKAANPRRSRR